MWNCAVFVPKAYFATADGSPTATSSDPAGFDVQTPPCLVQNEQSHARAWISVGSGFQVSANEMLRQWQLPLISIVRISSSARSENRNGSRLAWSSGFA